MKRFTILLTALLSVLAFSAVFQSWSDARAEEKKASAHVNVYDSTGVMMEAINAKEAEESVAPVSVYDATGAMLEAINAKGAEGNVVNVYDATGAMLDAINPDKNVTFSPVYDATGAMLDAINP